MENYVEFIKSKERDNIVNEILDLKLQNTTILIHACNNNTLLLYTYIYITDSS